VRFQALELLAELDAGRGVPALIDVLRSSDDRALRRRAIALLGEIDDPRAQAELRRLLDVR
jgi:HEAT repeat protein